MTSYKVNDFVEVKASGNGIVETFKVKIVEELVDVATGETGYRIQVPSGRQFDVSEAHLQKIAVNRQWKPKTELQQQQQQQQ